MPHIVIEVEQVDISKWRKQCFLYSLDKTMFSITPQKSKSWKKNSLSSRTTTFTIKNNLLVIDVPRDFYDYYIKGFDKVKINLVTDEAGNESILVINDREETEENKIPI